MSNQYDPTEDEIVAVLTKTGSDPRKLAIAYLRAQKRARGAETAFKIMDGVAGLAVGAATRDMQGAHRGVDKALRAARALNQATEKQK